MNNQSMTTANAKVLLIQPQMGLSGEFSCHLPLSLLYVAAALRGRAEVEILDTRVCKSSWQKALAAKLQTDYLFIGFTVMSGMPVAHSLDMTRFIKQNSKNTVVWGGSLPTVAPEIVMKEPTIDFCISGSAISSTQQLCDLLTNSQADNYNELQKISGLGFRYENKFFNNRPFQGHEPVAFTQIPYNLIKDYSVYGQIGARERIFPIYSAYGCPYKCSFCISPAHYRNFPQKWQPLEATEVVDHIEFLKKNYQAEKIYFYDDDSFVSIEHIRNIILEIKRRNLHLKLGFRGARVNEIKLMDQEFLQLLADTGTDMLHIGIESGSQPILDLYQKGITIQDIYEINGKLSKNNRIIAGYNWIVGTPGESAADIRKTSALLLDLLKTNPTAFIFQPNVFRVVPNSELEKKAIAMGYQAPQKLEDFIREETEQHYRHPWFTDEVESLISMLQITSYFVDHKARLLLAEPSAKNMILKFASLAYRPLARLRFEKGYAGFLFEEPLFNMARKLTSGSSV
jgi:radical SAM superfamily enzyme YgiQ (UPF0313 family)